jgi:hypothetical protein
LIGWVIVMAVSALLGGLGAMTPGF